MRVILSLILFVLATICTYADSLDTLYFEATSSKHVNIEEANKLIIALHAKGDADSLYRFTSKDSDTKMLKIIHLYMSYNYYSVSRFTDAVKAANFAVTYAQKDNDKEFTSDAYSQLGVAYERAGNFNEAINAMRECLHVDSILNDKERIGSDFNNLAAISLTANNIKSAEKYILEAIEIEKSMKPSEKLDIRYGLAAEIYTKANQLDKALEYAQMAYDIAQKGNDSIKIARRMSQMADVYSAKDEYPTARKLYEGSIDILEKCGEKNSLCINYKQLGRMLVKNGDYASAAVFLQKGEALAREIGNIYILQAICENMAEALKKKDPSASYDYLKEAMLLKDSINTKEMQDNAERLHNDYEKQIADREKAHKETVDIIQEGVIVSLIIIVLILSIILVRKIHKKDKEQASLIINNQRTKQPNDQTTSQALSDSSVKEVREANSNQQFLVKVTDFITANMSKQKITIDLLAAHMCMSRSTFIKKINNIYGDSANNFIIKVKMEKATRLLKCSDKTINEIASCCGFEDTSYFIRSFKQQFGMTPMQYRNMPEK